MVLFLANKSIIIHSFTLLSVLLMISSLNILKANFKLCGKPISQNLLHAPWNDWLHCSSKKAILCPVQPILGAKINKNKDYLCRYSHRVFMKYTFNELRNYYLWKFHWQPYCLMKHNWRKISRKDVDNICFYWYK